MNRALKIKVCGMRERDNIKALYKLYPDYIGFIFYKKSKRFVGEEFETNIVNMIPSIIKKVGVFVNANEDYILEKTQRYLLELAQLHGNESPEFCHKLSNQNIKVIKAFGIDENFDFRILEPYEHVCDYFLFDTKSKNYGGTGQKFNWNILRNYNNIKPVFLSGGIGVEDWKEIEKLDFLNIHAIDINSRFEIKPGFKNIDDIKLFINNTRQYL